MQLRLNEAERAAFDRLVRKLSDEMPGVEVTDAGAVRAAVVLAMAARGIDWPRAIDEPAEPPTRKKKAAKR